MMTVQQLINQLQEIENKDVPISITNMSNTFVEYDFEVKSFMADETWAEIIMNNFVKGRKPLLEILKENEHDFLDKLEDELQKNGYQYEKSDNSDCLLFVGEYVVNYYYDDMFENVCFTYEKIKQDAKPTDTGV